MFRPEVAEGFFAGEPAGTGCREQGQKGEAATLGRAARNRAAVGFESKSCECEKANCHAVDSAWIANGKSAGWSLANVTADFNCRQWRDRWQRQSNAERYSARCLVEAPESMKALRWSQCGHFCRHWTRWSRASPCTIDSDSCVMRIAVIARRSVRTLAAKPFPARSAVSRFRSAPLPSLLLDTCQCDIPRPVRWP